MKTVNIGELKNGLSAYLQYVKSGEEIVVKDRNMPVARILPFHHDTEWEREAHLVAAGIMKMPEKEMDWNAFFSIPGADIEHDLLVAAVIEGRGER